MQQDRLQRAREAVIDNLQVRFETIPVSSVEAINAIPDLTELKRLHRKSVTVESLDGFLPLLSEQTVTA